MEFLNYGYGLYIFWVPCILFLKLIITLWWLTWNFKDTPQPDTHQVDICNSILPPPTVKSYPFPHLVEKAHSTVYPLGWGWKHQDGNSLNFKSYLPSVSLLLYYRSHWSCTSNFTSPRKGSVEAAVRRDWIQHMSSPPNQYFLQPSAPSPTQFCWHEQIKPMGRKKLVIQLVA